MFIATPLSNDHELAALSQAVSTRACRGKYEEIKSRSHIQTFTRAQATRGHPKNPDFLLEAGELPRLLVPLETLRAYEGELDGSFLSGALARRPAANRYRAGPPPLRPAPDPGDPSQG
jgi:hypothetical protein